MEDVAGPLPRILLFAALTAVCSVQVSYHAAVSRLDESDIDDFQKGNPEAKDKCGRILKSLADQSGVNHSEIFWLVIAAAAGPVLVSPVCQLHPALCTVIPGVILYVFGYAVPDVFARVNPLKSALRLAGLSGVLTAVSMPFCLLIDFIAGSGAKAAGINPDNLKDKVSENEIRSMVNEGHEQGSIDEDEAEMITNIFELDDKQARDIMTHRGDIIAISSDMALDDAISFMVEQPNSRFPVYEDNIDQITGALYLKDAMAFHLREKFSGTPVGKVPHLLREVKFIPETVDVDDLFRQMQESRKQMAIVVDEYGQTSGLVTMEDILEEIVGNILDEYDSDERLIVKIREGRYRINGKALLEDVSEALGTGTISEDYDTFSGYLTEKLGHIPTSDDRGTVIEDRRLGYRFHILGTNGTMIGWTEAQYAPDLMDKKTDNGA